MTKQLDSHLKETESLEIIADFYKKQMNEIALRQNAIKSSVVSVDDTLQKALASLQTNTEQGLLGLKQTYVKQQDEMEKLALQQGAALTNKLAKLDFVVELVHEMQSMPKQIGNMEKALNNAVKQSEIAPATALCPLPSGAVIISNFMAVSLYTKSSIYKYTAEGENCKHMKQKKRRILPWFGYASLRKTIIT